MTTALAERARTATLVVVGPTARLAEAIEALGSGEEGGALRVVLIATEGEPPRVDAQPDVVAIGGLKPGYVNNAIAGVRLSSLPTVVWWRGGSPDGLDGVASLADRLVLDVDDPWPLWRRAPALLEHTALTDLRWARLTRWRAAMAHFFDLAQVREAAASFSRLSITGGDRASCALFAGWLEASLGWSTPVAEELTVNDPAMPIEAVVLGGEAGELVLRLLPNSTCLDTNARVRGGVLASRVVSLGDQSLPALLSEELRVRSRDLAFERALGRILAKHP